MTNRISCVLKVALVLLLGVCSLQATPPKASTAKKPAKAAPKPVAPEAEAPAPPPERKSVFELPLKAPYTDPFFPLSQKLPWRTKAVNQVVETRPTVPIDHILLKGISVLGGKRLALINNNTFAAGESGTISVPKGRMAIEVLEVKDQSAVIKLENDPEPKEIFLRPVP